MFQFFSAVGTIFTTIVNFIVNTFEILIFTLQCIVKAVAFIFGCIAYLPPFLVAFVVVPVSLSIVLQVINKGE